jgi:hypothetical protein
VKGKSLSAGYIDHHRGDIRLHVETFEGFQGITLRHFTPALTRDWRTWAAGKGLKGGRINKIMQAMTVPVRYAKSRGEIEKIPLSISRVPRIPEKKKESLPKPS